MAKKVLLCGEGPTDYGQPIYGSTGWEEGPLQPIIRKSVHVEIEFDCVTKQEVKEKRIQGRHKVQGHGVKAYKLCRIAEDRGAVDHIICYVDADRDAASTTSRRDFGKRVNELYSEIRDGFEKFSEERGRSSIPMIALKMIESWLLSDETAFARCFNSPPTNPGLPQQPELIWGDKGDPTSNYPKNYLQRVLKQYGIEGNRGVYKEIAEYIDINELRNKCSISFERFYIDIQII
ncbi:MAG: DUF4276 family protein [Bacillota bacterium]|nr:DUF4276 family protein [Bacillota bacterium]